jgi:hypothetical protein
VLLAGLRLLSRLADIRSFGPVIFRADRSLYSHPPQRAHQPQQTLYLLLADHRSVWGLLRARSPIEVLDKSTPRLSFAACVAEAIPL